MLYRIITEGINADGIRAILAAHRLDYSMFAGGGAYKGMAESTIIVDLLFIPYASARAAAYAIGRANNQECVLLECIPCTAEFIDTRADYAPPPVNSGIPAGILEEATWKN